MWWLNLGEQMYTDEGFHPMIHELAKKVEGEHGVTIRDFRKKDLEAEITRFIEVYNSAWEKNWGFVPITEEEVRAQASDLKPVLDERWGFIAERDGEVLGAALTLPDVNQVPAQDERQPPPVRVAHLPARDVRPRGRQHQARGDRPRAGVRPRRQARVPAPRHRRRLLRPLPARWARS